MKTKLTQPFHNQKVSKMFRYILSIFLLLFSINSMSLNDTKSNINTENKCQQVLDLIKAHKNKFKKIRKGVSNTGYADIWDAKTHLVGKNCQILRWENQKYSYTCNILSPSEKTAMQRYKKAKVKIKSCLGKGWILKERAGYNNRKGYVAIYANKQHNTVVATHVFETSGIFKKEWTNYIFIGSRKRLK